MDPEEARRAAVLDVGGVEQVKEEVRDAWAGAWAHVLVRDLRHGVRLMARSPGFTLVAVTSLALGVGGTAAAFGVVNAALLRPLPYPAADRLYDVRVWWADFPAPLSPADVLSLRAGEGGVADVGAVFLPEDGFSVRGREGPEVVQGAILTSDLPRVLGVEPVLGRWFSADSGLQEVLIGEGFWRRRLGGRRDALGRTIELDGEALTVVGVVKDVPYASGV